MHTDFTWSCSTGYKHMRHFCNVWNNNITADIFCLQTKMRSCAWNAWKYLIQRDRAVRRYLLSCSAYNSYNQVWRDGSCILQLISAAARFSFISSWRATIRLTLTPWAGSSSYLVTAEFLTYIGNNLFYWHQMFWAYSEDSEPLSEVHGLIRGFDFPDAFFQKRRGGKHIWAVFYAQIGLPAYNRWRCCCSL